MSGRISRAIWALWMAVGVAAALMVIAGCEGDPGASSVEPGACELSSDCEDPDARCVAGACVMECGDARDCQIGDVCLNGICSTATPCRQDSECQYDHDCVAGLCALIEGYCEANRDCNAGSTCDTTSQRCVAVTGECGRDADCLSSEVCAGGRCVSEVTPDCVRNSDCAVTEECLVGMCVALQTGCSTDAECGDAEICVAGQCEPECVEDRDCPATMSCIAGACEPECVEDRDCGVSEVCVAGRCEPECVEDRDCATGQICDRGACEPECVEDRDCPTDFVCTTGACVRDVQLPCSQDPTVCTISEECCDDVCVQRGLCPTGGDYWAVCTAAAECSTDLCIGGLDGNGHCTDRCASRQDCPQSPVVSLCIQSYHLITQQSGGNTLVGLCYEDDSGAYCNPSTTNSCFDGVCVDKRVGGVPEGVCSTRCRAAADCPNGWACGVKEFNIAGTPTVLEVCVPVGAACAGEGATAADQCYSGVCVTDDVTNQGFCTTVCDSPAQCPTGWGCIDAGGTGICAVP